MKDRFSTIADRVAAEPQGFCTDKVRKTVIRGLLPEKDLQHIVYVLTKRQDSMTKEEMAQDIGQLELLTPEAASVLVSAWFDGGRNKAQWEQRDLYTWIKQKLVTKLGSEERLNKVASVVGGKRVACEYGLSDRRVQVRGLDGVGVCVMVAYPASEDASVENCKYDVDMLVKLWKDMLPIDGSYRMYQKTVVGGKPGFEFVVAMPWRKGEIPLLESVRSMIEG